MARFEINQPLVTKEPRILVDAGLRPGLHRFRLVVTDDQGLSSRADEVVVQVSTLTPQGGFLPVRRPTGAAPAQPVARSAAIAIATATATAAAATPAEPPPPHPPQLPQPPRRRPR